MCRSLIHSELTLVSGNRMGLNFILWHVGVQHACHCLLKKLFPIEWSRPLCWKSVDHRCLGVFLVCLLTKRQGLRINGDVQAPWHCRRCCQVCCACSPTGAQPWELPASAARPHPETICYSYSPSNAIVNSSAGSWSWWARERQQLESTSLPVVQGDGFHTVGLGALPFHPSSSALSVLSVRLSVYLSI